MTPCPKPVKREAKPRKPLKRSWLRRRAPRRLKRAGSDPAYLEFVRSLPCAVQNGNCYGPIHAHHAGRRPGVGLKAPDDTAVPLCQQHHLCWHSGRGPFFTLSKLERFAWAVRAIADTQRAYAARAA